MIKFGSNSKHTLGSWILWENNSVVKIFYRALFTIQFDRYLQEKGSISEVELKEIRIIHKFRENVEYVGWLIRNKKKMGLSDTEVQTIYSIIYLAYIWMKKVLICPNSSEMDLRFLSEIFVVKVLQASTQP